MGNDDNILRRKDMLSKEEYLQQRQRYTDEQAQNLGYPSAEVLRLSDHLRKLAGLWRGSKDESLVLEYKTTLRAMIKKGYDINILPVENQLPSEYLEEFTHL